METSTDKQSIEQPKTGAERLAPYQWKKGQSGNILGRPKGKTMKEWARDYLSRMTDDERDAFMEGIPKDKVWAMAEGNPETKSDITSNGQTIVHISEAVAKKNNINDTPNTNTEHDS